VAVDEGGGGSAPGPIVTKRKSMLCMCCFGGEGSREVFAKNYLHRRGVLEGLIAKVMSTLGCEMEAQDLRCAYVHRSHLVHMIYYL
jgi:hypothetical protein